jgi:hypothetical protein
MSSAVSTLRNGSDVARRNPPARAHDLIRALEAHLHAPRRGLVFEIALFALLDGVAQLGDLARRQIDELDPHADLRRRQHAPVRDAPAQEARPARQRHVAQHVGAHGARRRRGRVDEDARRRQVHGARDDAAHLAGPDHAHDLAEVHARLGSSPQPDTHECRQCKFAVVEGKLIQRRNEEVSDGKHRADTRAKNVLCVTYGGGGAAFGSAPLCPGSPALVTNSGVTFAAVPQRVLFQRVSYA